jgi:uncharacterized protein (TIGR02118 family)
MPKLMLFVRRKPGMTREAFREHYETVHAPLALANMTGLDRYVRNYTVGFAGQPEPAYDCVTEMWFSDPVAFSETMAWMRSPASQELHDDEELFIDRSSMTAFFVEEAESAPAARGA